MIEDPLVTKIANDLSISISEINIAIDPDEILGDERLLDKLIENEFIIIRYEDPVSFRYEYESKFRDSETRKAHQRLLIIYFKEDTTITQIPYDILTKANVYKYNFFKLFPQLSYQAVKDLPRHLLSDLYRRSRHKSGALGKNASIEFILNVIFGLNWNMISSQRDLLRTLIQFHISFAALPEEYGKHLVTKIEQNQPQFSNLPLIRYFTEQDCFLSELQIGWEKFIRYLETSKTSKPEWVFDIALFEDYIIQPLITQIFSDGGLQYVPSDLVINEPTAWYHVGLVEQEKIIKRKVQGLFDQIEYCFNKGIPLTYQDWFEIADLWSKLKCLTLSHHKHPSAICYNIKNKIDNNFDAWINANFDTLSSLPPNPPKVVHQIPDYLARRIIKAPDKKIALIVVDGLAYWQWKVIENNLIDLIPKISFSTGAVFAWIPTITSISRQSIFSGKRPIFFQESITTTIKEPDLWETFWANQNYNVSQIQYFRKAEDKDIFGELFPNNKILGLVINTVDELMHGMVLGDKGMYNQIDQWSSNGRFYTILEKLLTMNYQVFVTSDHGNIETTKNISVSDGILASSKGERVRIYSDKLLIPQVENTKIWKSSGLPENIIPVIALDDYSFKRDKGKVVVHGGASIQEIIVPFIEVRFSNE